MLKAGANNIQVTGATLTGQNTGSQYTMVKFWLNWDNSWRMSTGPANYDAAWVFVKYKIQGGDWAHATLSTSGGDHSITNDNGTAMTISPASDGKGVFFYRTGNGTGNIDLDEVLLRWNYGTDGVSDAANLMIKVFAIEMVWIPQGPFFIGDGNISTTPSSTAFKLNNTGNLMPYKITGESAITFCSSSYTGTDQVYDPASATYTLPVAFPKGYDAFWVMKYEITQIQYVDFFNTLPYNLTPRGNRALGNTNSYRNSFYWSNASATNDATLNNWDATITGDRACNYLMYPDGAAYADWAALRPMSELEYEKASRGCDYNGGSPIAIFPLNGEYAWGNTTIYNAIVPTVGDGTTTEGYGSCVNYNCNYSGGAGGPLRNGIFAAKGCSSNQRQQAGASYYGVMELSGNLREIVMGCRNYYNGYNPNFTATNGDGAISGNGYANVTSWTQSSTTGTGSEVTTSYSYGAYTRGGSCGDASANSRTSDRSTITTLATNRYYYNGMRCARTP